jgi:putative alpha-1,2-mannosidase
MFTTGRGGIPGNNDTGALSSYYIFAALGLFPVAGQDLFLLGSPFVKKATVLLHNGRVLTVEAPDTDDAHIYVKSVSFNGKALPDFRISAKELLGGGTLTFTMSDERV